MACLPYVRLFFLMISLMANSFPVFATSLFENLNVISMPGENATEIPQADFSVCDSGVGDRANSSCPVNCFRPDPVCGVNGVTYWCGCADAHCAGVRVAKTGFCEIGNGGNGPLSGQALLLVHIVWLILAGFAVLIG
eukprot:TRINITY_DN38239_c0_g1_i2.p1 TRINITY_DN38239_c0_g1~~TRINITY_DN38239_c0_g1_i2.p1  ORF type:complete len:137 (+),score=3.83 TRINITY_DN38239_c0_g1_i2:156-566(+)